MAPRLVFRINCQRWSVIIAQNDFSFTSVFCSQNHSALSLSYIHSEIQTYLLHNQHYTEDTNGQNNDDKIKKPTLGSHSISINYCNNLEYFRITHKRSEMSVTVLKEENRVLKRELSRSTRENDATKTQLEKLKVRVTSEKLKNQPSQTGLASIQSHISVRWKEKEWETAMCHLHGDEGRVYAN